MEDRRLQLIPGKEALAYVNEHLQATYGVSLTPTAIINAMEISEVPLAVKTLINRIEEFSTTAP